MRRLRSTKYRRNPAFDLFGEVPVTLADVRAWLLAVPRIDPDGPRAVTYCRVYRVVEKIRAAKLAGAFDQAVDGKRADESAPSRLLATLRVTCGA